MSVISLFFGQCGNQVGQNFYSTIYDDITYSNDPKKDFLYYYQCVNKWFNVTKTDRWDPRAILIDTENKGPINKETKFTFNNILLKGFGGSANNWAFGYFDRGHLLIDEILNCVRLEAEKSDYITSFFSIFSSSGGTGSGVGSLIMEKLKEEYPTKLSLNGLVLPYTNGDVVTQSYNSLLTLTKLYDNSDAVFVFENDRLHYQCTYSLGIRDVNFIDLNNIISFQLSSTLQPLNDTTLMYLGDMCTHPSYKLLQIKTAPLSKSENVPNLIYLVNSISKPSRYDFYQKTMKSSSNKIPFKYKTFTASLISRGPNELKEKDIKGIKDKNLFVDWLPDGGVFKYYYQPKRVCKLDNSLTLLTNGSSIGHALNLILEDSWQLFSYKAYLHHYEKYGADDEYFQEAFTKLEKTLFDYQNL